MTSVRPSGGWRVLVPEFAPNDLAEDIGVDPETLRDLVRTRAIEPALVGMRGLVMYRVADFLSAIEKAPK
jgi:hypothetical protein